MRGSISVLHVDDDVEFGELTATYLERVGDGVAVDHVETAAAALEHLETEAVDCVLSDYEMPGRDGLELLAAVRENHPNLPFILFTGKGTEEVAEQALSAGATDYVQKEAGEPVFKLLANRIRNAVSARVAGGSFVRGGAAAANGGSLPDGGGIQDGDRNDGDGPDDGGTGSGADAGAVPTGDGGSLGREAIDGAPDGFVVIDDAETIRDANRAVREIVGVGEGEMVGASLTELVEDGALEAELLEGYRDAVETLAAGETETVDAEFEVTRNGEERIYEARFSPRPDEGGGVVGTIRDVTDQRERVDELQRYETLLRTIPDTVLMTDVEGNILEFHGFEGWSGYEEGELEGASMAKAVPDEHLETAEEVAIDLFTDDERMKATYEMEIETKDGELIPFENHLRLLPPDEDGMVPGTMSVLRNIKDRKERERQLNALNEAMRDLVMADSPEEMAALVVEAADDVLGFELTTVAYHDEDEGVLEPVASSCEGEATLGNVPSSGGCPAWEAFQAGDVRTIDDVDAADGIDRGETPIRSEVVCPIGEYGALLLGSTEPEAFEDRDVSLAKMLAGNAEAALERVSYLEELEERERELEMYETAVEQTDDSIAVVDETSEFQLVNSGFADSFGTTREELVGQRYGEDIDGEDVGMEYDEDFDQNWIDAWEQVQEEGHAEFRYESITHVEDGPDRIIDNRVTGMMGDDGTVLYVIVARDITQHREREQQIERLHESARELMAADTKTDVAEEVVAAVENTLGFPANVVRMVDESGNYLVPVAVTESASDLLGERASIPIDDHLLGEAFVDGEPFVVDDILEEADADVENDVHSLMSLPLGDYGLLSIVDETVGAYDDGDLRIAEILTSNAEAAFDRVEKEEALRERERQLSRQIERLDQFANIVSHDLRNPLNVAKGHLSFVREHVDDPEHVDTVENALDRMEAIIQDVLTLAREGDEATDLVPVDLAETATTCWENVDTREATLDVEADVTVLADESRLQQLLENIMRNGIDHVGDDVAFTVGALQNGFYVEDDGPGIPEADRDQIFEAGYSTSNEGTGFGLNIVRTIAEAHDWEVALAEGSDGGARFEFTGVEFAA